MNYFYFKKLDVYNYSKELVKYIYLVEKVPQRRGIRSLQSVA